MKHSNFKMTGSQNFCSIHTRITFVLTLTLLLSIEIVRGHGHSLADDIAIIHSRRVESIVSSTHNPTLANRWRNELTAEGNWTDVDYTHGCPASRADWKAPEHFNRLITMTSLWTHDESDVDLLNKINLAMDYWFANDFTNNECINGGSVERFCPCGTPGFWNPNWWYQMILMPRLVGNACLLLKSVLTEPRFEMCVTQVYRAYERIDGDPNGMMGAMTGANLLDVTWSGTSLALLISDQSLLLDALSRSYNESEMTYGPEDGIKVDGSFMQHTGQLLTGSYGSVFLTNMIKIFTETQNTGLEPPSSVQSAFATMINGSEWFMYHKNDTSDRFSPILLWEYSVIGRSISHKYSDWRGIGFNLNELLQATNTWTNYGSIQEIVQRLQTGQSVNPGGLVGTRYFHVTDYLVHRGLNYIVTLKMFSKRTTNSECYNSQNPFGFHLSDGSLFTYLNGDEYTDVAGGWDWELIPGTTSDYGATPLLCHQVEYKGKETFVGGLGLEQAGIAVMNYTNPNTGSMSWTKTFFFFPNSYIVQYVGEILSSNLTAPVLTTLDQRHLSGPVHIDGEAISDVKVTKTARRLWHDRVGYEFVYPVKLTVDTTPRRSNWSAIGTSEGNETLRLMAAYFEHPREQQNDQLWTYFTYLDVSEVEFEGLIRRRVKLEIIHSPMQHNGMATAIVRGASYGQAGGTIGNRIVSLVFLTAGEYNTGLEDICMVETDAPILLMFQRKDNNEGWTLAVSDPSQELSSVLVRVYLGTTQVPFDIHVELPQGAWAGSMSLHEFSAY